MPKCTTEVSRVAKKRVLPQVAELSIMSSPDSDCEGIEVPDPKRGELLADRLVECLDPRPHVIVPEFLTENEEKAVWREIEESRYAFSPGTYQINYVDAVRHEIKRNLAYTVNELVPAIEQSVIRLLFYNRVFLDDDMIRRFLALRSPVYQTLRLTRSDTTRVSMYAAGDYYNWHTDQSPRGVLTLLLVMSRGSRAFEGGDFELQWSDEVARIPFQHNVLIIFPRNTPHRVTPIESNSDEFWDGRFSIQCFPDFAGE